MRLCFVWISLLILCFACTPEDQKVPDDILSIDKMKVIIWEMTFSGEYSLYQKEEDTTIKSLNTLYFNEVLNIHHIDKNTFTRSFDFYQEHPALNKILLDSVSIYAERQRPQIYKRKKGTMQDSLRRVQPL